MCRKKQNNIMGKFHSAWEGKGGFTLVELSIVMALLAILATMITTFSVLMNQHTAESKAQNAFLEDCSMLKEQFSKWLAENDSVDAVFEVDSTDASILYIHKDGGTVTWKTSDMKGTDSFAFVMFSLDSSGLIKCSARRFNQKDEMEQLDMVFFPRCYQKNEVTTEEGGTS